MMQVIPSEVEPDKPQSNVTETNAPPVHANESRQNSNERQRQQAMRMMELLTIALKGVEWKEIEEGRADDENRY